MKSSVIIIYKVGNILIRNAVGSVNNTNFPANLIENAVMVPFNI